MRTCPRVCFTRFGPVKHEPALPEDLMDLNIFLLLLRDGLTSGAIYALLGVAIVLVFTVTRVLFVPQGEFVAFGALSMVAFEEGRMPGLAGLLLVLGVLSALVRLYAQRKEFSRLLMMRVVSQDFGLPLLLWLLVWWLAPMKLGVWAAVLLTIAMVSLLGVTVYRLVFEPLSEASVLVLLIAAFGVHMVLVGLGLYFFGPEGFQTQPLLAGSVEIAKIRLKVHDLIVVGTVTALMLGMRWYFTHSMQGKALRASAVNRVGASLVGISTARTGAVAFGLAAAIGAVSGILVGPVTTVYYDTGFMIGLKGLVAAVLGGLVSYPLTFASAILLAVFEAGSAFWVSSYKEVLVFLLVLPVLLWRSFGTRHDHGDDE